MAEGGTKKEEKTIGPCQLSVLKNLTSSSIGQKNAALQLAMSLSQTLPVIL